MAFGREPSSRAMTGLGERGRIGLPPNDVICFLVITQQEESMQKLTTGDDFQNLTLNLTDGSTLELPRDIDPTFAIVVFYRGHW